MVAHVHAITSFKTVFVSIFEREKMLLPNNKEITRRVEGNPM